MLKMMSRSQSEGARVLVSRLHFIVRPKVKSTTMTVTKKKVHLVKRKSRKMESQRRKQLQRGESHLDLLRFVEI